MATTKNKQRNCPHTQVEHSDSGKLVCANCDEVIFDPSLEPPPAPPPSLMDKFKLPKKQDNKEPTKKNQEFIGMGLSCPHCNKHIEVAFR